MSNPIVIPKNLIPDPLIHNPSILLHCCCAPCSGGIITSLLDSGLMPTVLFYNPNIHPEDEYLLRKRTLTAFLEKTHVPFIDSDYNPDRWRKTTNGLEQEPQRGKRCSLCFQIRLDYSARLAAEKGFRILSSSFGISRWKDMDQVNQAGQQAAKKYNVIYWDYNWRKNGGQDLMREVTRRETFYEQTYCGCRYSVPPVPSQNPA